MEQFLATLEQLKKLEAEKAFEQLFHLFSAISHMDTPTVIAAFQAAESLCRARKQEWSRHSGPYQDLNKAMINRMQAIVCQADPEKRDGLGRSFFAVTKCILVMPTKTK
jgi:hypothetical protein